MKHLIAVTALLASTVTASALELGRPGMDKVYVWRDRASFTAAIQFIEMGMYRDALSMTSCVTEKGVKAVQLPNEGGIAQVTVMIASGPHKGCRGVVAYEDVR